MKLLFCTTCFDVRKLGMRVQGNQHYPPTTCACGDSWGYYTDDLNAVVGGQAIPLGIANTTLLEALNKHKAGDRTDGMGHRFEAFVIPRCAPTVTLKE